MAPLMQSSGLALLAAAVPRGGALPDQAWAARHRGIIVLLWVHVVALVAIGVMRDESLAVWMLAPGLVAAFTMAAMWKRLSQNARASMATLGLLSGSATLISFFDGLIEAHFHFFIVIAVVSLYQSWHPYLLAVGFVVAHHLVLGTLMPNEVYNHAMALHNPWLFALVHGGAVLAESVACLVFWRFTEDALDAERASSVALKQSNVELAAANSQVADLVAMLSHDVRTPLTVLIGYSDLALESWPEMTQAQQLDFVGKVSRTGHALHTMLEDTLAVSVIDGDGVAPRQVSVRIDEAVQEALAALPGPKPYVDLQGLTALTALVDPGHLVQVLTNLFTNAIKYGGERFTVNSDSSGDDLFVRISDSGPGVPASFVPHLFERFTRSEDAREGAQKGTGLGLYITRSLLLANGGGVTYETTPGGGATFCIRLPRIEETADLLTL